MPKIQFYPTDITYKEVEGQAVVYLYGRTPKGEQLCVRDKNFSPYFIVVPAQTKTILGDVKKAISAIKINNDGKEYFVTRIEDCTLKLLEEPTNALKVYTNLPKAVPFIKDEAKTIDGVKSIHEYDLLYERRYLINKGITPLTLVEFEGEQVVETSRVPVFEATTITQISDEIYKQPRVLAFDIETYTGGEKSIQPEKNPILMIAIYTEHSQQIITWKRFPTDNTNIEFVKSESELIQKFKDRIEEYRPDFVTGFFSDGFDFPYIKERAKKYKIKLDFALDRSELAIRGKQNAKAEITGIAHIDTYKFVKRVLRRGLNVESFTLNNVAGALLGEKKLEVDLDKLSQAWDANTNLEQYCTYNLHDAKLAFNLFTTLYPSFVEFVKILSLPIYDVNRMSFSQIVEWYLIKQAYAANEIALNKPSYNEQQRRRQRRFKGASVLTPKPGLYENIAVFDYRSLYPTIIASHNISLGTLQCQCCQDARPAPTEEQNYWFCTKKRGFISRIIEDLITRRLRIKEILRTQEDKDPLLHARSMALKDMANAFYGYLGFFAARWYSYECGSSVTAWARHYIKQVIDRAQKEKFAVLYSDTDSVFLSLEGKTKQDALALVHNINQDLPELMELEYEGFYPAALFVSVKGKETGAKKKYAMLNEKGKLTIKGFESVRRNWSPIAKQCQREVLNIILKEKNLAKAVEYVREITRQLTQHLLPVSSVVIFSQLSKDISAYESIGPNVAAAQLMQQKGYAVGAGTTLRYIIIQGKGRIRDKVKLEEDATPEEYDAEYYITHQILPAVESIFLVLGYTQADLVRGETQQGLGGYFS